MCMYVYEVNARLGCGVVIQLPVRVIKVNNGIQ